MSACLDLTNHTPLCPHFIRCLPLDNLHVHRCQSNPSITSADRAMLDEAPQPRLLSAAATRYGRHESFREFGYQSSGHASVGHKSLGKLTIDCEFLFKKSQWGVLGDQKYPAGIIYMNLNFGPPQGCRVKRATVTITLDEVDPILEPMKAGRSTHPSGCPAQITVWYGPKDLGGQMRTTDVTSTRKLVPEVNVLGNGGGGLGYETKKAFKHQARWSFNGQLVPGQGTWIYKTLKWDLAENELDKQSFRSSTVRTGFAFEHSGQPFLMKVDIDGKLESWNERTKSKFRFGDGRDKQNRVVTLLDFEDYGKYKKRLDDMARSLPRAMEMENMQEVPVEIPDTIQTTTFRPLEPESSSQPIETQANDSISASNQGETRPLGGTFTHPSLGNTAQNQSLLCQTHPAIPGPGEPIPFTIDDLRSILQTLSPQPNIPGAVLPGMESDTTSTLAHTLTDSEETMVPEESTHHEPLRPGLSNKIDESDSADRQEDQIEKEVQMLELLKIPFVVAMLQLLSSILNSVGYVLPGDGN